MKASFEVRRMVVGTSAISWDCSIGNSKGEAEAVWYRIVPDVELVSSVESGWPTSSFMTSTLYLSVYWHCGNCHSCIFTVMRVSTHSSYHGLNWCPPLLLKPYHHPKKGHQSLSRFRFLLLVILRLAILPNWLQHIQATDRVQRHQIYIQWVVNWAQNSRNSNWARTFAGLFAYKSQTVQIYSYNWYIC